MIVNAELLVHLPGTISLVSCELSSEVTVKLLQVLLWNWILCHPRVVCYDFMFGAQMSTFYTPSHLAKYSGHIAFYSGLIIKGLLFWRHLVTQESCKCGLVNASMWLLDLLIKCLIEAFRMLRTQLFTVALRSASALLPR